LLGAGKDTCANQEKACKPQPKKTVMEQHKIFMAGSLYPEIQTKFEKNYNVFHIQNDVDFTAIPDSWSNECRVFVTNSGTGVDGRCLAALPGVKLVANFGVGLDLIDLNYCTQHGIAVSNTPGVITEDVADLTVGLLLTTVRQIVAADSFVREGRWLADHFPLGRSIRDMKIGIVGLGAIGQEVARLCVAFGSAIGYFGPRRKPVDYTYYQDLEELADWSDVLIAACPGGEATREIISAAVLDRLGPNGIFINVARGSVVDEQALVEHLVSRTIWGAGLDVFATEPNIPEQLLTLNNVVLQPHLGGATHRSRLKMGNLTLANVDAFFAGKSLLTPVIS
jgi:lactate dehydrogenase-like 2-hydroxyacid dehydrogenase